MLIYQRKLLIQLNNTWFWYNIIITLKINWFQKVHLKKYIFLWMWICFFYRWKAPFQLKRQRLKLIKVSNIIVYMDFMCVRSFVQIFFMLIIQRDYKLNKYICLGNVDYLVCIYFFCIFIHFSKHIMWIHILPGSFSLFPQYTFTDLTKNYC